MPELSFHRHGEELLRVALGERTAVGRAAECDVSLPDPDLPPVQAVIERRPDGWHLLDRSGTGTTVAGAEVPQLRLADGAEITLGAWRAVFRTVDGEDRASGATQVRPAVNGDAPVPARLRLRHGGRERTYPVTLGGVDVGKEPTSDVPVDDPFVSARHLRIEPRGARWVLVDLGSTNGTYISGARVSRAELPFGLPVHLGDAEIVLEPRDAPEPGRAEAFEGMITGDAAMRQVFELVERVGPSDAAVTILGETGTGKELVARALHARSPRREAPFIPVNCSAIAESLIESELFGHEKGAFSGAERMRKGAFEEADRGTIFLDEIGELPLDLQPKLLRVLELGEVKRVGASRPIQVNVRIVAATHRDLRAQVRAGRFREDLFYRLNVMRVHVPALRERRQDVPLLVDHFLERFRKALGRPVRAVADDALARLVEHPWPGNVRELENVIERAVILARGDRVTLQELPTNVVHPDRGADVASAGDLSLRRARRAAEIEAIRAALRATGGNRTHAARVLEISHRALLYKLKEYGIRS